MNLRDGAREAYIQPNAESSNQALGRELAQRLSGDKALLCNTKRIVVPLAESPAFREVHPAIVKFLEEFGQYSGAVTPVLFEAGQPESIDQPGHIRDSSTRLGLLPSYAEEEPWQAYLASRGLWM